MRLVVEADSDVGACLQAMMPSGDRLLASSYEHRVLPRSVFRLDLRTKFGIAKGVVGLLLPVRETALKAGEGLRMRWFARYIDEFHRVALQIIEFPFRRVG